MINQLIIAIDIAISFVQHDGSHKINAMWQVLNQKAYHGSFYG